MYSQNDWRNYTNRSVRPIQHSEDAIYSENDYRLYLEHKFSLPKIDFPDIDFDSVKNKAKQTFSNAASKVAKTASDLASKVSKTASDATSSVKKTVDDVSKTVKKKTEDISKAISEKKDSAPAAAPGKWIWPNGKNSKEYNHWYYTNHKDKWAHINDDKGSSESATTGRSYQELVDRRQMYLKDWDKLTDEEKQKYFDEVKDDDFSELFISQFLARPISALTLNVPSYLNAMARDMLSVMSYVNIADKKIKRMKDAGAIDEKTGFRMKNEKAMRRMDDSSYADEAEDLAHVNPGFYNWNSNTKNNCMLCTTTYDLRRRGYDVTANTATDGYWSNNVKYWYPDARIRVSMGKEYLNKAIEAYPEGARGNLMVQWNSGGGHSMIWEVRNGKMVILDGQTNTVYDDPDEIDKLLSRTTGSFEHVRVDNLEINPEAIKRCAKS